MLRACPFDSGEVPGKVSASVREPISLLCCQIPTPLADFKVSLKERSVSDRFRIFISHTGFLLHASRSTFKWPVCEALPLT